MSILESDWFYWGLGSLLAVAGLIRVTQQRRQQLTELLRTYVEEKQGINPNGDES
jgi:hypothetical protein